MRGKHGDSTAELPRTGHPAGEAELAVEEMEGSTAELPRTGHPAGEAELAVEEMEGSTAELPRTGHPAGEALGMVVCGRGADWGRLPGARARTYII